MGNYNNDNQYVKAAFIAIDTNTRNDVLQMYSVSHALKELDGLNIRSYTSTSRDDSLSGWFEKLRQ